MATKTTTTRHQFLAVINTGPDADYTTEPRHRVELDLPFNPSGRSSMQQLRQACKRVRWQVSEFMPQGSTSSGPAYHDRSDDIYLWLCDENGQPTLFVSGLLAVREGRATKAEFEAQSRRLLPQVTCEQSRQECRLLVSTAAQKWADYEEPVGFGDELDERESEVLEELEGVFDEFCLGDTCEDEDGTLYVRADGWRAVTVPLPFQPGPKATAAQLRFASATALAEVQNALPEDWEVDEEFGGEVWLLDDDDAPVLYVTGLLDVREGRLSPRRLKAATERAKSDLPVAPLAARPAT